LPFEGKQITTDTGSKIGFWDVFHPKRAPPEVTDALSSVHET
jgi:hypothetical protein